MRGMRPRGGVSLGKGRTHRARKTTRRSERKKAPMMEPTRMPMKLCWRIWT